MWLGGSSRGTEVPQGKRGKAVIVTVLEVVSFARVWDWGHFPDLLGYCAKHLVCDFNGRYLKPCIFFPQRKREWKRKNCEGATGAFSACDNSWPCGTSAGLHWCASCFEQGEAKAGEIFDFLNCSLAFRVFVHELHGTGWAIFSLVSWC